MDGNFLFIVIGAFVLLGFLIILDEILDLPHLIFGAPPTPINWTEIAIEVAIVLLVGLISVYMLYVIGVKRKRAEETLRETRGYLENLINYANAPIIVWDTEFRITRFNRAFEHLTGYTANEVVGQELSRLFPEASRDESLSKIEQTLSGEYWKSVEIPILRKDGGIQVALWNSANIYSEDGKTLLATIAQGTDITERKKAEEKIKHLNLVLRAIRGVNQLIIREKDRNKLINGTCKTLIKTRGYSSVWIVLLDEKGKFITSAEAGLGEKFTPLKEMFKKGKLNECGKRALKQSGVVAIKDPASTCVDCPLLGKEPDARALTIRLEHKDKVFGLISLSIPIDFADYKKEQDLFKEVAGDIAFAFYSMELEEEHKRLEQQREKSRREAEFYADVLAHDIGNLDQITMGYLYLLQMAKDEETKKKNVNGIKKSIMKSKRLAESIKILKKIEETKLEKFDLNESIERSIKNIKEYSDKEIELDLNIDKKYYVNANDFLDRVFFNILENAVEFTFQDKAIIDIKTEEKNGLCNVHIHDRGIGIPENKKKDILENLETLSKRTGMGLYLTKKILERFNGKFEIKDADKGTEIVISIPVINGGSVRNVHAQRPDKRNAREGR
jgi:PAS domain S-box-containing protein